MRKDNKIYDLREEEINIISGGDIIAAGKAFLWAFLDAGTAFSCINIMQGVYDNFCHDITNRTVVTSACCCIFKEVSGIVGFTLHSLTPTVYQGLADPILPAKLHAD